MKEVNISDYLSWLHQGKDFGQIKIDLSRKGFKEDEIKSIIRTVDDYYLQDCLQLSKLKRLRTFRVAGFILIGVSVFILLYQIFILRGVNLILLYFNLVGISGGLGMIWYSKNNRGFGFFKSTRERRFLRRGY